MSYTKHKSKIAKPGNIKVLPLDWESDDGPAVLRSHGCRDNVDLILACDCVYNYALIDPFIQTCIDLASLRNDSRPTVCLVAQQLRQPDVLEQWLSSFSEHFSVWRIPDEALEKGLRPDSGYVLHLGLLKG